MFSYDLWEYIVICHLFYWIYFLHMFFSCLQFRLKLDPLLFIFFSSNTRSIAWFIFCPLFLYSFNHFSRWSFSLWKLLTSFNKLSVTFNFNLPRFNNWYSFSPGFYSLLCSQVLFILRLLLFNVLFFEKHKILFELKHRYIFLLIFCLFFLLLYFKISQIK